MIGLNRFLGRATSRVLSVLPCLKQVFGSRSRFVVPRMCEDSLSLAIKIRDVAEANTWHTTFLGHNDGGKWRQSLRATIRQDVPKDRSESASR